VYQVVEEQATRTKGNDITFLLGDLNTNYGRGGTHNIDKWASADWWQNDIFDHASSHHHTLHTKYQSSAPVSWIDHILYLKPNPTHIPTPYTQDTSPRSLAQYSVIDTPIMSMFSDHRPLTAKYYIIGRGNKGVRGKAPKREFPSYKPVDLDPTDSVMLSQFSHDLEKLIYTKQWTAPADMRFEHAESLCLDIVTSMTRVAKRLNKRSKKRKPTAKDGWSPTAVSFITYAALATMALQHLKSTHGRSWQTPATRHDGLQALAHRWQVENQSLMAHSPQFEVQYVYDKLKDNPLNWAQLARSPGTFIPYLQSKIGLARSQLHYRKRKELRCHMRQVYLRIEAALEEKKLGTIIKKFCPKPTSDFHM
jgi:hypothetical protein